MLGAASPWFVTWAVPQCDQGGAIATDVSTSEPWLRKRVEVFGAFGVLAFVTEQ